MRDGVLAAVPLSSGVGTLSYSFVVNYSSHCLGLSFHRNGPPESQHSHNAIEMRLHKFIHRFDEANYLLGVTYSRPARCKKKPGPMIGQSLERKLPTSLDPATMVRGIE